MQAQSEQNLPIDIHTNKLLDWLISRRHCNREWPSSIQLIREKINNAIQDMPAVEEITKLLVGTYINYFHCRRIVELLKDTEAASKNIFGHYSSQRMKDWQEIMKLYEKDNVYLAEAANMLIRNVNYEVPSLKKQIAKCQQMQEECDKKIASYSKNADDLRDQYYASCKNIGIQGNDIKKELMDLANDLPATFTRVTEDIKLLQLALGYYRSFLQFTLKSDDIANDCLPMVQYLISKGNTTTYEWRTGEAPEVIEETKPNVPIEIDNGNSAEGTVTSDDQIDFGDMDDSSIDFGDDASSGSPNGDFVHIQKEDLCEDAQSIDFGDGGQEISWDISVDTSVVSLESGQGEDKVAKAEDALSILDNPATRNNVLNELMELEGFLEQRLTEMQSEGDVLLSNQFQTASTTVQLQTADSISKMLADVKQIIEQLTNVKMQHLYLIRNSAKYVDRLAESLKQKLNLADKMIQSRESCIQRKQQALKEQTELEPRLQLIIQKTKELQKQMEEDISKRYKNRHVNIMGGVQAL